MKSNVTKVERIETFIMPPGEYHGTWTGYEVTIPGQFKLKTEIGIRGLNVPCKVLVDHVGQIQVLA